MDWANLQSYIYGGGVIGIAVWLGKTWILPLLTRTFDNSVANATASGNILTTITAERDQWKARAEKLDADLAEMRREWAQMKSDVALLQYQLKEARDEIASLTGKPLSTGVTP
jgi:septal ring factor EnvC (AmiA/AmiB activator)